MPVLCIAWQHPGPWLPLVITIVIYLTAARRAPVARLALGGVLASLAAAARAPEALPAAGGSR